MNLPLLAAQPAPCDDGAQPAATAPSLDEAHDVVPFRLVYVRSSRRAGQRHGLRWFGALRPALAKAATWSLLFFAVRMEALTPA